MLRKNSGTTLVTLLTIAVALLLPMATAAAPARHFYGDGHVDTVWTSSFFPPYVEGTGTGVMTTNLANDGQAITFGLPITSFVVRVLPAAAPTPVQGTLVLHVPSAVDPWWGTYSGGMPPGITTGGDITFDLTGYAEHHPFAVTLYGTFTVTGATGQYAGMVSNGDWTGSSTGGGSSFGPYFDFAMLGSYL